MSPSPARIMEVGLAFWPAKVLLSADLTEGLRTGKPQDEIKHTGAPMFARALQQAGTAGAGHGCDERHFRGQLSRLGGKVRLLALSHALNMLIEFGEAFDFTGADFIGWCRSVGFTKCEVLPLAGPASAGVAYQ
jgi:hypothetical protein